MDDTLHAEDDRGQELIGWKVRSRQPKVYVPRGGRLEEKNDSNMLLRTAETGLYVLHDGRCRE